MMIRLIAWLASRTNSSWATMMIWVASETSSTSTTCPTRLSQFLCWTRRMCLVVLLIPDYLGSLSFYFGYHSCRLCLCFFMMADALDAAEPGIPAMPLPTSLKGCMCVGMKSMRKDTCFAFASRTFLAAASLPKVLQACCVFLCSSVEDSSKQTHSQKWKLVCTLWAIAVCSHMLNISHMHESRTNVVCNHLPFVNCFKVASLQNIS